MNNKIYYHLPGLFEHYSLYQRFLPLFFEHREYFYEWCDIGSLYGILADCIWAGGRVSDSYENPHAVFALLEKYKVSARLTMSNSLLQKKHLDDQNCNALCQIMSQSPIENGIIVHSDLLLNFLKEKYPSFYFVSSTTKVITDFSLFIEELNRQEFRYVVVDFRLNKHFKELSELSLYQKEKVEFLCNECCSFHCLDRKQCYEAVSYQNLGESHSSFHCKANQGYRFSQAMKNPGFISVEDILNIYRPLGFSQFKIEGRGLGSALILEFLIYYMVKPEFQIHVREAMYLDNMLDLF